MQKIKLLHIINNLNTGGAETLVGDLACYQKEKYNVDILTISDFDSPIKDRLKKYGLSIYSLDSKRLSPLNILRLRKFIKKYEVVHVHLFPSFYFTALASLWLKEDNRPKLVHTIHSSFTRRNSGIFKLLDKFIYSKYDVITAISESTKNIILKKFPCLSDKLVTIPNGANIDSIIKAQPINRSEINVKADNTIIVQVANFRPQKDQATLIQALTLLPESYIAVFAGAGPTMAENIALAKELNVYSRCRFLGRFDKVPSLLKTADVVVMSSKWEGFGLAALEGMAANKPVIASDVDGLHSVVDGAGKLFAVGDYHQLADTITSICLNQEEYKRTQDLCNKRSKIYDIRNVIPQYDAIYTQ